MLRAAKKFCLHGPNVSSDQPAVPRDNANARGYNWRWCEASTAWLQLPENILCIDCKAKITVSANQVGRVGLLDRSNERALDRGGRTGKTARWVTALLLVAPAIR